MTYLQVRRAFSSLSMAIVLALPTSIFAQTFRGGIGGAVVDPSGASVAGVQVVAVGEATHASYTVVSSSAGEFVFPNLPLGSYSVSVAAAGFKNTKVVGVPVTAGSTYTLAIHLSVAAAGESVEVTANALVLDTASDQQSSVLPEKVLRDLPITGRDYTQLVGQTTGFAGVQTGGGGYNFSVNGSRSNAVNWQIEGTDNNDLWWNIPAVNQTGVNGIAGVIFPLDAIENFSFVTAGSSQLGRNPAGTVNLTVKAGSNALHGTAFYYNHNELFQATNPFSTTKPETRNQHYGFSVGGPIAHDKLFFFLAGEHQGFLIGASTGATEPSAAYQTAALQILSAYGVSESTVAKNLLYGNGSLAGLWPSAALNGAAVSGNYTATGNAVGHSFNGVIKLDGQLTEKDHIAATWFVGQGNQTAPSSSALAPYFEEAPIHVENYSLVYNRLISPSISNQLAAGVSYFNQVFADANTDYDPYGLGLDTGVTASSLAGSPHLIIGPSSAGSGLYAATGNGFDPIGVTPNSGRNDITGHLNDDLIWTKGAHQFHFGGEFREAQVDDFYQTGQRGTIYFDGTQGPWAATSTPGAAYGNGKVPYTSANAPTDPNLLYLADFLAGFFDPSTSNIVEGNPKRQVFVNTFALYAQDAVRLNKRLNINFGVRYDYEGPVHSNYPNLSVFDPTVTGGLAVAGQDVPNIYKKFWSGFSPRVGFAYELDGSGTTVLRGGYGFYEDSVFMKSILQNTGAQNISVFGPEFNPAGSNKVVQASGLSTVIKYDQPIFDSYTDALAGQGTVAISTFDKNFRPSYTQQYDLNLQHSFSSNVIWQLGYVGTHSTHLLGLFDINPETVGSASLTNSNVTRPYYTQFSSFGVIDEVRSNLGSNYNSLQTSLRLQNYHGLSSQLNYTWSHALDYETGFLPYVPQDPTNERAEYGNSDYDVRNTFSGYLDYQVPSLRGPKRLTHGWDLTSSLALHGGTPYTVTSSSNPSGNGESADRAVQKVTHPSAGVSHSIVSSTSGSAAYVRWFSTTAFADAAANTYSSTRRGQNYNPGYDSVDLAVVKNTPVNKRVSAQFRADIINIFNHTNLAPVGLPTTGETATITETVGQYLGDPGIGPGEPVNVQFALKIIF
jgi:hypothetical protein